MIAKNSFIVTEKLLASNAMSRPKKKGGKKLSIHIAFLNAHLGEIPLVAIMMDNELLHVQLYISQKSAHPSIASAYRGKCCY